MEKTIERIIASGRPCVFVSPHLDDAVLSCGNLMLELVRRGVPVTVVTVFTEAGEKPETFSVKAFLRQCGVSDARALFAIRREEDRSVLEGIGARWEHLGFPDAMWRKKPSGLSSLLGRLLPELGHVYPTYRIHVTSGRVSRRDRGTEDRAETAIRQAVGRSGGDPILFFPLGLGRHVDHVLTHRLGRRFADRVAYYADFPYCLTDRPDVGALARRGLTRSVYEGADPKAKHPFIAMYATQHLFAGEIPAVPEEYFLGEGRPLP